MDNLTNGMLDKLYLLLKICRENFPITSQNFIKADLHMELFIHPSFDILKKNLPITKEQRILINILARLSISKADTDIDNIYHYHLLNENKFPSFMFSKNLVEEFIQKFQLKISKKTKFCMY